MKDLKEKILIVDDEPDILEIVGYNLKNEGYQVYTAENGDEGVKKAKKKKPDLIILDVMMPIMDGIEACEKMRKIPELDNSIITFFTARGEDFSMIAGFDAGADDYITKPVKPRLLISKVKSLLRRKIKEVESDENVVKLGDLVIDKDQYKIFYKKEEMILPRKEFELLSLLTSNPGKVFKREEILDVVWGNEVVVGGRTIDVHIRKLREKLGEKSFKTVKGVGYKYVK
ncbi:response regulator receiver:transcriptional regulatory protein [Nonlabens tegetincola]|uniref:Response regulator receiver:transcriptional regulatory protein n=1 Tax=Nonlabens tegetincola TaxID=323273 RepID=A0A090QJ95_9FLAO|nr:MULTISPECIES: response regulator transcription factor [Nonlabens]MEE2802048.1 response regulator transcription factor [Bacteroidota bacterium]ALM20814.1 ArsR family transcriptional regulator [Nonlabens sp. MIC269]ARN72468.1 DNA-binding response regulator [Nonlabens tegetincola]PQJ18993.1 DNA-binding response regulator [Nonlabens tegetincola]GAK95591.1 response regulator receiver:transcriptional regulatory protein [Nonlabens tegetincola]